MSQATELIARQMAAGASIGKIWGTLIYNVKDTAYGAKGDGVADDTTALINAAAAASVNGGMVVFPPGTYKTGSFTAPFNVTLWFMNGAKLSINSGATVTINGPIEAGEHQIFNGSGVVSGLSRVLEVYPEWWGAVGDGVVNDSTAIQKAVNASDVITFRNTSYYIGSTVSIPQARHMEWRGKGFRRTVFTLASNITGFSYLRNSGTVGSTLVIRDIQIAELGYAKTSYGITFRGFDTALHDNWLRMYNCSFYGMSRQVDLKYCGQCFFIGNYHQYGISAYLLDRDSSFITIRDCMVQDCENLVYADDPLADAVSNGLFIQNCNAITGSGANIRIVGWQGVYINGGAGYDLGTGGTTAIYLGKVQDFDIMCCFISSDEVSAPNRHGIDLSDCHSGSIANNSIVNNDIGIRIDGSTSYSTKLLISGNIFEGNDKNEIFIGSYGRAVKIMDNSFMSTPPRTGTDYEVYGNTVGTDYNIVKNNTFVGATYTIVMGASSIINENIFSVPV